MVRSGTASNGEDSADILGTLRELALRVPCGDISSSLGSLLLTLVEAVAAEALENQYVPIGLQFSQRADWGFDYQLHVTFAPMETA